MSRKPSPHHLLFIAKASVELAKAASSRAIKDYYVGHDRNQMLQWAWRLRRLFDPFWGHDPHSEWFESVLARRKPQESEYDRWKLPNSAFVGWSPTIRQRLSDIYDRFYDVWRTFENQCALHPDHPLITTWFRPVNPTESPGTKTRPAASAQAPSDSRGGSPSNTYFTRDHRPNWDISSEDAIKCFNGAIADQICSAFEKRRTRDDLFEGLLLESAILEQLMPHLYPPAELDPEDEEANQSQLSLDDKACGVFSRLALEDKPPTTAEVARRIPCSRGSLYRCQHYMELVEAHKRRALGRKGEMPRGWRNRETGQVEASIARSRPGRYENLNDDDD
ncbi:MAG: hypothetical protein ACHRXM_15365 [Isosphaerales bacterium]